MGVLTSIIDRSISGAFSSNAFKIRSCAFINCTGLTNVSFPECYSIGERAFSNCSNLTTIRIGTTTVCTLKSVDAFSGCNSLTSIYVPSSLVDSYKSATNWSEYADKIKA